MMTNAELKFAETVPVLLRHLADAALKIADELNKANCLKALEMAYGRGGEGLSKEAWHDAITSIVSSDTKSGGKKE